MDPVTALGAVSSAIGIASFALDLSVGLFKLAAQIRAAKDCLKGVGETVKSVAYALEEVEQLLRKEEHHVRQEGGSLRMFSAKGLARVKETTDACLCVLWKVEAVAVGGEEPKEAELAARLAMRAREGPGKGQMVLDARFASASPGVWGRLVFAVSAADKLSEYGRQLQNFQISLGLILNVVTVTYLLTKSPLTDDDRRAIEAAKEDLHRPRPHYREAAEGVLHGCDPVDAQVNLLPPDASAPGLQKPEAQHPSANVFTSFATFTNHGLEASPKLRVKHAIMRKSSSSTTPGGIASRDMGPEQLHSNEGKDPARSVSGIDSNAFLRVQRQRSPSFQSSTALRGGDSSSPAVSMSQEASSNPMKVYSLQKQGDWRQEKLSHADILQRLAKLDLDPLGVLDKKLDLPTRQQARIDAIHAKVNGEEANRQDYEWKLRQLELKGRRLAGLSIGRSWGLLAIIVYLERECQQHAGPPRARKRVSRMDQHDMSLDLRPWKCPNEDCKYNEYGWSTEKDMDRHYIDEHAAALPMYACLFDNCPYESKQEGDCRQHMEKAHNWQYVGRRDRDIITTYTEDSEHHRLGAGEGIRAAGVSPNQQQIPGPPGEAGIKSEFGRMFSGIGSGVQKLGQMPPQVVHYHGQLGRSLANSPTPTTHPDPDPRTAQSSNMLSDEIPSSSKMNISHSSGQASALDRLNKSFNLTGDNSSEGSLSKPRLSFRPPPHRSSGTAARPIKRRKAGKSGYTRADQDYYSTRTTGGEKIKIGNNSDDSDEDDGLRIEYPDPQPPAIVHGSYYRPEASQKRSELGVRRFATFDANTDEVDEDADAEYDKDDLLVDEAGGSSAGEGLKLPSPVGRNGAQHLQEEDVEADREPELDASSRGPSPPLPNHINVLDFLPLVAPTASCIALPPINGPSQTEATERNAVVRFHASTNYDDADMMADDEAMISYGSGPIAMHYDVQRGSSQAGTPTIDEECFSSDADWDRATSPSSNYRPKGGFIPRTAKAGRLSNPGQTQHLRIGFDPAQAAGPAWEFARSGVYKKLPITSPFSPDLDSYLDDKMPPTSWSQREHLVNPLVRFSSEKAASESELDDDLIKQLTLLLTPARPDVHLDGATF